MHEYNAARPQKWLASLSAKMFECATDICKHLYSRLVIFLRIIFKILKRDKADNHSCLVIQIQFESPS